jgi:hypothetical protein
MRFDWTNGSIGIVSAVLMAACVGCSGGNVLPVGGPFGGTLDPSVVVDGGIPTDSSGVLERETSTTSVSAASSGNAPTWTQLYQTYMLIGTMGNCTFPGCHDGDMDTPSDSFTWLASQMQLGDSNPAIVQPGVSCLSWFGGTMPMGGPTMSTTATKDFMAWAAAGAKNN